MTPKEIQDKNSKSVDVVAVIVFYVTTSAAGFRGSFSFLFRIFCDKALVEIEGPADEGERVGITCFMVWYLAPLF